MHRISMSGKPSLDAVVDQLLLFHHSIGPRQPTLLGVPLSARPYITSGRTNFGDARSADAMDLIALTHALAGAQRPPDRMCQDGSCNTISAARQSPA